LRNAAAGRSASAALDAPLDRSVVLSFDRTGFRRHARRFVPGGLDVRGESRTAIVTGASSGLGIENAKGLLERGLEVILAVRDVEKGERVRAGFGALAARGRVERLDVGERASVEAFAKRLEDTRLDVLVHNAGSLLDRRTRTGEGLEATLAVHLVGPLALTHRLWPSLLRSDDARIVHVSSGGMYGARLDVGALFDEPDDAPFDGVRRYALAKRAQIVITEEIAARAARAKLPSTTSAMHPGWANTPGVRSALPRFFALTRRILRTPAEGADTALFLALAARAREANGRFYFDRGPAPTHLRAGTRETSEERTKLWARACDAAGVPLEAFAS
jgi:NAD(P)-dependent dehydrogenase (short-subunit alcohol dehydrogenase family)